MITKKDAQKWVNALRSGKYNQGKGRLEEINGNVCCLGVACKVFIYVRKQEKTRGRLNGSNPTYQGNAPIWLKGINNDLRERTGKSFVILNDRESFTFNEIADIIELEYIHEIGA